MMPKSGFPSFEGQVFLFVKMQKYRYQSHQRSPRVIAAQAVQFTVFYIGFERGACVAFCWSYGVVVGVE